MQATIANTRTEVELPAEAVRGVDPASAESDRVFWHSLWITAIVKVVLAAMIPLTGDEAYFVLWGEYPDYGFYDHGGMTGWWLTVMLWFGKTVWLMRVPAILTTLAIGVLIWRTLRRIDAQKAGWIAAIYLWSPHGVLNVLTTTDTPLLFFSAIAGIFAFRACRDDRKVDYLLAGVFLGFAFLAKYFAVLLGISFGVAYLFCVGRPRIVGLLLTFLGVLPSAAVNILWNYHHSWTNILFNLYTRRTDSGFSLLTVGEFIGISIFLFGPLVWFLLRPRFAERAPLAQAWQRWRQTGLVTFAVAFAVPQLVMLLVSFGHGIGVHWPLSFYPFLFAALPALFSVIALRQISRAMAVFSVTIAVIVIIGVLLPVEYAKRHPSYASIILSTKSGEVLSELKKMAPGYLIATPSYAKSSVLSFYNDTYVPVLGHGSYHGRHDDLLTDMRKLDGRDILIVTHKQSQATEGLPWFEHAELREITISGARLTVLVGRGFKYEVYRDKVLRHVASEYYQVPEFLASWSPPSFFLERYDIPPGPMEKPKAKKKKKQE